MIYTPAPIQPTVKTGAKFRKTTFKTTTMNNPLKAIMLPTEDASHIWRDVVGYEGLYQVSNTGLVKSYDRIVKGKDTYTRKGIMMSLTKGTTGYVKVGFTVNNKTLMKPVHRLVAMAFIPNPENKKEVNHIDGNKTNNNVENLEWCTSSENKKHAFKIGLADMRKIRMEGSGEDNPNSKLTRKDVLEILNKYKPHKYSTIKLAKEYGVDRGHIWRIIKRKIWKTLD